MRLFFDYLYLQQTITLVLFLYFVRRQRTPVSSFEKKKDNKTKEKKNRQAARPKKTIPGRENRIALYFTLRICANLVIFLLYLLFLCSTEEELRDVSRLLKMQQSEGQDQ